MIVDRVLKFLKDLHKRRRKALQSELAEGWRFARSRLELLRLLPHRHLVVSAASHGQFQQLLTAYSAQSHIGVRGESFNASSRADS